MLNRLLDRVVPSIALSIVGCLESVALVVQAEGELVWAALLEVGGLVERKNTCWASLAGLSLLDKEQKTLSGLAGPCNDWVRNLSLLTTEVEVEVCWCYWLVAEPEVLLGESELPGELLVD